MLALNYQEALQNVANNLVIYIKPEKGNSHFLINNQEDKPSASPYVWLRDEGYIEVTPRTVTPDDDEMDDYELPSAAMVYVTDKGKEELPSTS